MVEIRPAQESDGQTLANALRPADIAEARAGGFEPAEAVLASLRASSLAMTALVNGELACVFGVVPVSLLGGIGCPWLLGTKVLDRHSRILVRLAPKYIWLMRSRFPHLVNSVHAEHTESVRWLRRLGFTFSEPWLHPETGATFCTFEMKA